MSSTENVTVVFDVLFGSSLFAVYLRRHLSDLQLGPEAAKGVHDTQRADVIQRAAKTAFLDPLLKVYRPNPADSRGHLRQTRAVAQEHIGSALGDPVEILHHARKPFQP